MLFQVNNPIEFTVIIPCFESLLNKCEESHHTSTKDECSLMALWLRKIVHSTEATKECLYLKALHLGPERMQRLDDISLAPQLVALSK